MKIFNFARKDYKFLSLFFIKAKQVLIMSNATQKYLIENRTNFGQFCYTYDPVI